MCQLDHLFKKLRTLFSLIFSLLVQASIPVNWSARLASCFLLALFCQASYAQIADTDLLNYHGTPSSRTDHSFNIFFDSGAWHGYSLPPASDSASGFVGPFLHNVGKGEWAGYYMARLKLRNADSKHDIVLTPEKAGVAAPGFLRRTFTGNDLKVEQTLFYPDSWHAVVRIEISSAKLMHVGFNAVAHPLVAKELTISSAGSQVVQKFSGTRTTLSTRLIADGYTGKPADVSAAEFSLILDRPLTIDPDHPALIYIEQTLLVNKDLESPPPVDYTLAWNANRQRWAAYLTHAATAHLTGLPDADARQIAAKAIVTLIGNWRAARGDLLHDGVVPSYSESNYNGFWAWDSWKHVAALAPIAPDLARAQMLAMFDYQTETGMIPDCIFLHKADNNGRNSKPPLAGWAALRIFLATGDKEFLVSIYDRLVRYHRWWYAERDHEHNGLVEYGATDGTLIAAAWESGMDNAVRFDETTMLKNSAGAWSADQESVDLNAYLVEEKRDLAEIAGVLGKAEDQQLWLAEADNLKGLIQAQLYDTKAGYFFDRKLKDGSSVRVFGPEGWIPLWAGVATREQAQRVAAVMTDPKKFATKMPFPSLAADDARFSPVKGYWRGAVWLDQAYFAITGLRRYGFDKDANELANRLVASARGTIPFHEVYDPLTGDGLHAANFSWSAAHYLMLLRE